MDNTTWQIRDWAREVRDRAIERGIWLSLPVGLREMMIALEDHGVYTYQDARQGGLK